MAEWWEKTDSQVSTAAAHQSPRQDSAVTIPSCEQVRAWDEDGVDYQSTSSSPEAAAGYQEGIGHPETRHLERMAVEAVPATSTCPSSEATAAGRDNGDEQVQTRAELVEATG
eukprot:1184460-Prorocentrum_lima.AAC.1